MPKVAVFNIEGKQVGDMELNDDVFAVEINEALLHKVIVNQLANRRQGTVATKTRGLVSGGGRKPWRQKGTGRARVGSTRTPVWVGGGVTFGPEPRDYSYKMPKKARRAALRSALSVKVRDGKFVIVDQLAIDKPKTKTIVEILEALEANTKTLVVLSEWDANIYLALRNIPNTLLSKSAGLNVYDILNHDKIVITKDAVAKLEEVLV